MPLNKKSGEFTKGGNTPILYKTAQGTMAAEFAGAPDN